MTFHRWIPKLLKFKFIPAVKLQFSQGPWLQPLSLSIFKRRWGEMGLECPVDLPRRSVRTRLLSSTPESVASNLLSSIMRGDCGACAEGSEPMCCRLAAKEKVRGPRYWKMRVSETLQWQRQCSSVPLLVNWWLTFPQDRLDIFVIPFYRRGNGNFKKITNETGIGKHCFPLYFSTTSCMGLNVNKKGLGL